MAAYWLWTSQKVDIHFTDFEQVILLPLIKLQT